MLQIVGALWHLKECQQALQALRLTFDSKEKKKPNVLRLAKLKNAFAEGSV